MVPPRPKEVFKVFEPFDFFECFTTTFLRAQYWLNWVDEDDDEDEVGLKERPEDTRYISKRPVGLIAPPFKINFLATEN